MPIPLILAALAKGAAGHAVAGKAAAGACTGAKASGGAHGGKYHSSSRGKDLIEHAVEEGLESDDRDDD